jgi:hypothetical protein
LYGIIGAIYHNRRCKNAFIGTGLCDIIPIVAAYVIGHDKIFLFTVKRFEYNIKRLLEDGSVLARLVQNCTKCGYEKSIRIYWFHRGKKFSEKFKEFDRL